MTRHLAQLNMGRLLAPTDDPRVAEFMAALDRINGLGRRMPGFVWMAAGSGEPGTGNTEAKIEGDPQFVSNLTVWKDAASLEQFVWNTVHRQFYERRAEWFEVLGKMHFVTWWIAPGTARRWTRRWSGWPFGSAMATARRRSAGNGCARRICGRAGAAGRSRLNELPAGSGSSPALTGGCDGGHAPIRHAAISIVVPVPAQAAAGVDRPNASSVGPLQASGPAQAREAEERAAQQEDAGGQRNRCDRVEVDRARSDRAQGEVARLESREQAGRDGARGAALAGALKLQSWSRAKVSGLPLGCDRRCRGRRT